jgi:hypothetical protein
MYERAWMVSYPGLPQGQYSGHTAGISALQDNCLWLCPNSYLTSEKCLLNDEKTVMIIGM